MHRNDAPYLLYDGDCDFCRQWASWLARHDAGGRFRITPWQDAPSPPMTPLLQVVSRKAVQVVTPNGARRSGGKAILFALREIGWHPTLVGLLQRRPFVWSIDLGYRIVAANRPWFSWLGPR